MSQNKKADALIELEMLALKFATGHTFLEENSVVGAWVFCSPSNKRDFLKTMPREQKIKFSFFTTRHRGDLTKDYVLKSVEKDCKDVLFDKDDKISYYDIVQPWRDKLGDKNVLASLEDQTLFDLGGKFDADALHELNTTLIENLSVNPEYVKSLRENVAQFINAERTLKPAFSYAFNSDDYLKSMVNFSEQCCNQYQVNHLTKEIERGQ